MQQATDGRCLGVSQKKLPSTVDAKRQLVEPEHPTLSIRRQCALLGLNRASWYAQPAAESAENLALMRVIDAQYTKTPMYGWPRMTAELRRQGYLVNGKRVRRLMQVMGLQALYPKPKTSQPAPQHRIYPYLLRYVAIVACNQVWSTDSTYIPMAHGFMYLVAIIDWYSRYVLSWRLSNTLDGFFCQEALMDALHKGTPTIFNTDQGAQFTATAFTSILQQASIQISMDGRGRALDNIFVERLWRTVKWEDIYLHEWIAVDDLEAGLRTFFHFYNEERLHQSLGYRTPAEVYYARS